MNTANEERRKTPIVVNYSLSCMECKSCLQRIPLSRHTLRNPLKVAEEIAMAQELHSDCQGTPYEASLARRFREGMIRYRNGERLAWSC